MDSITRFHGPWRFLSNFHPSPVPALWVVNESGTEETVERVLVPTVEHAYQAAKCRYRDDFDRICAAPDAKTAKVLGQDVELIPQWEETKLGIMTWLLDQKFSDPILRDALLATQTRILIEGNTWHDVYWGLCTCPKHGYGANWLGRLLMRQRGRLAAREQDAKEPLDV